ncbi:MAG TPA: PaaX family transcriptional regulator C-terminal domain-containing protein [Aeromicrobium sp.]|nr:PaaX family transcriptional regulator C-terminal domain-containing protein [Aeromicrobium sp.]HKY57794.1 PaaX family transcriptional regulator C-terminal domain-containing protein [Aeromicrobium sp.]
MHITPLSARSVALSVLLGAPDGRLPVRDLVASGVMCDISPPTMRVALSRLVGSGELTVDDGVYTLSPHHLARLRAQHDDIAPRLLPWNGQWETVVIVESGRDAGDRARLRHDLTQARLGELREGVWMRPANLDRPPFGDPHTTTLVSHPQEPDRIVESLWDLDAWADRGRALLTASRRPDLDAHRLAAVAALVRHLRTDPALPRELTPPNWPADEMRAAYDDYRTQLVQHALGRQGALT